MEQIGVQALFETAQFNAGLSQYVNGLNQAKGATTGAAGAASSAGNIITSAIGYALGTVVVQAASAAVAALGNFVTSGIQSVAALQRLDIMLESLAAKELVAAGSFDTMSEAMAAAGPIADMLLQRLKALSLTSPFEYQDVVNTFRLNMAFGASAESALQMTQAILDMAAAMGLTGPFLERIVYNFSQMQMVGQVTARDIRDLALAGVDLTKVLRDQLGMSVEEVNAALDAGTLSMQDITNAFIEFSNANFGGAAERMSLTFDGLKSSFKDLAFFASQDIFGPFIEALTADLGELFKSAKALVDSGALKGIGEALLSVYEGAKNIPQAIGAVVSAISNLFGGRIQSVVADAFNWGVQLVANLAAGIISGISQFLVAAMNAISNTLSYWLSPGSPPRVAPEIDQWGMEAMNEYLNGFTEADFTALDSLQGALQSAFDALNIDNTNLMQSLSTMFSEALAGGELDATFFDQLMQAAGPFGAEIADLAQYQLDLADATDAAAAASDRAREAALRESQARNKSRALINEYNDLLQAGASDDILQAKLDEINAQETIVQEAANTRSEAEAELAIQQARVDLLSEQISLQEQLIQQLTDLFALQEQQDTGGAGSGAGGEGGGVSGGGGGGAGGGAGGTGGTFISDLQGMLDQAGLMVSNASTNWRDTLITTLSNAFAPIVNAWNNTIRPQLSLLGSTFLAFIGNVTSAWQELANRLTRDFQPFITWWNTAWPQAQIVFSRAWEIIKAAVSTAINAMTPLFDALSARVRDMMTSFGGLEIVAEALGRILLTSIVISVVTVTVVITALMAIIAGLSSAITSSMAYFETWKTTILNAVALVKSGFDEVVTGIQGIIAAMDDSITSTQAFWTAVQQVVSGIGNIILGTFTTVIAVISFSIGQIFTIISGFIDGVVKFFQDLSNDLVGHSIVPDMMDKLVEVIGDGFDDLLDTIEDFAALSLEGFTDWIADLTDVIQDGLNAAQEAIESQFTNLYNQGAMIIQKIADGVRSKAAYLTQVIRDTLSTAINQAIATVTIDANIISALGARIATAIGQGILDHKAEISSALLTAILNAIDYAWANSGDAALQMGKDIDDAIESGLTANRQLISAALLTAVYRAIDYTWSNANQAMYDLGYDLMGRLEDGIAAYGGGNQLGRAMTEVANQLLQEYSQPPQLGRGIQNYRANQPIIGNTSYKTLNMPTSIVVYGGMDVAQSEAFIRRVVRSEFGV